jgi:hypothetical protein
MNAFMNALVGRELTYAGKLRRKGKQINRGTEQPAAVNPMSAQYLCDYFIGESKHDVTEDVRRYFAQKNLKRVSPRASMHELFHSSTTSAHIFYDPSKKSVGVAIGTLESQLLDEFRQRFPTLVGSGARAPDRTPYE